MTRTVGTNTNIPVERLKDRLEFLFDWFDPNLVYLERFEGDKKNVLNVYDVASLFDAIVDEKSLPKERRHFPNAPVERTLRNYINNNVCSLEFIDYLSNLYSVSAWKLRLPKYNDFLQAMEKDTQAMSRWKAANEHLLKKRGDLAVIGKHYYRNVDELPPDFPLVGKQKWIIDPPHLLALDSDVPSIVDADPLRTRTLSGLEFETSAFRHRMAIRERLKRYGTTQYNGESYRLVEVSHFAEKLNFTFSICKYFDYVDTCEACALELADWHVQETNNTTIGHPKRPFGERPDEIMNLSNRAAYCGINCLTIIKNYTEGGRPSDVFFIHPRDGNRTEARNTIHVIPAGGHQPPTIDSRNPINCQIFVTVCREFFEEMFDKKELAKQHSTGGTFFDLPNVKNIYDKLFSGQNPAAKVYLHGFGFDPVTTKPEMLVTILLDWDRVTRRIDRPAFRYSSEGDGVPRILSEAELLRQAKGYVEVLPGTSGPRLPTLPAGAACLMLAARNLQWLKHRTFWS